MVKGLSLFANVGIAETYLKDAGIDIVVANELLTDRARFYSEMHPDSTVLAGDITQKEVYNEILKEAQKEKCEFLIATPPCFIKETKIMTQEGYKFINKLTEKDCVLTHLGRFKKVLHLGSKDNAEIYSLKAYGIEETFATGNHPYYTKSFHWDYVADKTPERIFSEPDFKDLKDLDENHYIAIPRSLEITFDRMKVYLDDDYIWVPVEEVVKTDKIETVYNIEVEDDNTYTANNAVVHNCQGMSISGKMEEDDPRNLLIKYAIEMIKYLRPKNIIIENVPAALKTFIIHNGEKIKIVDFIEQEIGDDYFINYQVVNTADHGTPQSRKRSIFLISSISKWEFPKKEKQILVKDVISHLPSLESGQISNIPFHNAKTHNPNHIRWMRNTPSAKTAFDNPVHFPQKDGRRISGFSTTYKRIDWDKPAPTITMANGSVSSQNNVHPGREKEDGTYSDARVLTLKEIFILTGLPDDWTPPDWASDNLVRRVIGEGIPPKLIEALTTTMPK